MSCDDVGPLLLRRLEGRLEAGPVPSSPARSWRYGCRNSRGRAEEVEAASGLIGAPPFFRGLTGRVVSRG